MDKDYILITDPQTLADRIALIKNAKVIGIDTETTGLDPHTDSLRLIQLAADGMPVFVIDGRAFFPKGLEPLAQLFASSAVFVFQNAKFDMQFLKPHVGIPKRIFDTMLAAQLLSELDGPKRFSLDALVVHYLNKELPKDLQKSDWSGALREEQYAYAASDARVLLELREKMLPDLRKHGLVQAAQIEFSCASAVASMEYNGIRLDVNRWQTLTDAIELRKTRALDTLSEYAGPPIVQMRLFGDDERIQRVNFDSNREVLAFLHQHDINVASTSKQALVKYRDHPIVSALTEYRTCTKSLTSFLEPMIGMIHPQTGRLHPKYRQIGSASGRMSCHEPNIQQIPRSAEFRSCFVPEPGHAFIVADYSQIELRVVAQISQDPRMLKAYQKNEDLHALTASLLLQKPIGSVTLQERQAAKAVNFGLVFGMGAAGLATYANTSYGVSMSIERATLFRRRFFEVYKGVKAWHESLYHTQPTHFRTLSGRRFKARSPQDQPDFNTAVQGTAADIAKKALGKAAQIFAKTSTAPIGFVHDEIIVECDAGEAERVARNLQAIMEQAGASFLPDVPCQADLVIADNWSQK